MRAPSLVDRLALMQMGLAGLLLGVFAVSAVMLAARTLERQEGAFLTRTSSDLVAALEHEWSEAHDLSGAAEAALEEGAPSGVQAEILDDHQVRVRATPPLSPAPRAGELRSVREHVPLGAWVVVSISTRPRHDAVRALALVLAFVGLPLFALAAVASRALAARMLRPLRRMSGEARQASESGVVTPLGRVEDPAELQQLAGAFNLLLARLERMLQGERQFTQDAAHELRTPLTVVSGELEFAVSKLATTDPLRIGLERAGAQAKAMSELVEALLFLRRADPAASDTRHEFVAVNLSDLMRDAAAELLARNPERVADLVIDAEDEVLVHGHTALLGSALRNLLGNALKFTRPGEAIRASVRTQSGWGALTVEDAGRGIPIADRERVFDPFYRDAEARAHHEGFGLGLAILRRVVRAHGGEVEVAESALGGARFELRLPAWRPSAASS